MDATRLSVVRIAQEVPNKSSSFMTCLDFVNMSDNNLDILFVGDRARSRQRVLLYPPKHHRRTAKQIKHWFKNLGGSDQKKEIRGAHEYQINLQHDDDIIWDGQEWTHPMKIENLPSNLHLLVLSPLNACV